MITVQIVCYYTPDYIDEASRLVESLGLLGLSGHFELRESLGSWGQNVHIRAPFLKSMRKLYPDKILLSLDADCVVHYNCVPNLYLYDIAFHTLVRKNRSEKLPGTLYLNPTLSTDDFLDNWEKQNILHPQSSDRVNFARAINESSLRICDLPPEFCWIFDISREVYGNRTPIIEHLQASRSFRKPNSQKDITRRQRISEIKNELS